jgi:autotransporter-associated beta strand protein
MKLRLLSILLCLAGLFGLPDLTFAAVRTWSGGGPSNIWTTPANWEENDAPDPGDSLVFPAGSAGDSFNNFPIDTEFLTISMAEGHRITGNRFKLVDELRVLDNGLEAAEIFCDVLLKGTFAEPRTITFSTRDSAVLNVRGVIHGQLFASLRKEGPGSAWLSRENLYAGPTIVAEGVLGITQLASLGTTLAGTTLLPGGRLTVQIAAGQLDEPLTLNADADRRTGINAIQTVTVTGPITLQGTGAPYINASDNVVVAISGKIGGPQGVRFDGVGTVMLTGATANTYAGTTSVSNGTLLLQKPGNTAVPNGLVIGGLPPVVKGAVSLMASDQIQGPVSVMHESVLDLNGMTDTFGALTLAGGFVKTGTGVLTLGGDVTALESPTLSQITGKLSLGAQTRTLDVRLGAVLYIPAVISAPLAQGIVKRGLGNLQLVGANNYTGPTIIEQGAVIAADPLAFGSPAGGTSLVGPGSIQLITSVINEPLAAESDPSSDGPTLAAALFSTCTWGGPIAISGKLTVFAFNGGTLRLTGLISGAGALETGGDSVEFGGTNANTYGGDTSVTGRLKQLAAARIPDTSRLELQSTWNLNAFNETIAGVWGSGGSLILLGGAQLTVVTRAGTRDVFAGAIGEKGSIRKKGAGIWELTGTSNSIAPLTIMEGTVRVKGSIASDVTLEGGILEGTGQMGKIGGPSGTLRPGTSPGVLHGRSLDLGAGVSVEVAIDGPVAGAEYSRLDVTGSVSLGQASLALAVSPNFLPSSAGDLIIIVNDGADPIVGTFSGLPEGALVEAKGGKTFRITYAGGTGNDVVLKALSDNSYYLSEGATGSFFDLDVLIANPNVADAPVTLTFLREDGGVVVEHRTAPGMQRITLRVDDIAGVEDTPVSTVVKSDDGLPLIVERTMRWDQTGYGAHTEKAAGGTALTWYFAEGAQGFFSTYLLLANPGAVPSTATVQYLREGLPALTRSYPIGAGSRFTVNAGADPELVNTSFGIIVTFDQPGIAERAMYFGADPVWKGGHESAGVTAPSVTWFLAEGATGPFFETFVLLANPNGADAVATVTFLTTGGAPIVKEKTVPANGRLTVNIESEDPALANAAVSTKIDASLPVIVERAQYWPDPAPIWHEAHNSFGVTAAGTKWGLAEGRSGGGDAAYQTYILIANPGATAANVTITFLLEGGAPVTKTFDVPPASRFNVQTGEGTSVPEVANKRFGAVITSDQPIVVERAMYSNAGGQTWAAGTNATATRLP